MAGIAIGELLLRTGVKIPTIRYYEQIGLLGVPTRTEGKQRRYGEDDIGHLNFIRNARELGFEVDAIRELMELDICPGHPVAVTNEVARRQLEAVQGRIERLLRPRHALDRAVMRSDQDGASEVGVIQALA